MTKKYLEFNEESFIGKKTKIFRIWNKVTKDDLGEIKWNGSWRQYCFYPDSYTFWAKGCLLEVAEFINKLMFERKTKNE